MKTPSLLYNKSKKLIDERKTNTIQLKDSLMIYDNELIKNRYFLKKVHQKFLGNYLP